MWTKNDLLDSFAGKDQEPYSTDPVLTALSMQTKSIISVSIKYCIHQHHRVLFYDITVSEHGFIKYPDRNAGL